jgi:hypothetical protein
MAQPCNLATFGPVGLATGRAFGAIGARGARCAMLPTLPRTADSGRTGRMVGAGVRVRGPLGRVGHASTSDGPAPWGLGQMLIGYDRMHRHE